MNSERDGQTSRYFTLATVMDGVSKQLLICLLNYVYVVSIITDRLLFFICVQVVLVLNKKR